MFADVRQMQELYNWADQVALISLRNAALVLASHCLTSSPGERGLGEVSQPNGRWLLQVSFAVGSRALLHDAPSDPVLTRRMGLQRQAPSLSLGSDSLGKICNDIDETGCNGPPFGDDGMYW
eukprot:3192130-Rhodomonas_salina.1